MSNDNEVLPLRWQVALLRQERDEARAELAEHKATHARECPEATTTRALLVSMRDDNVRLRGVLATMTRAVEVVAREIVAALATEEGQRTGDCPANHNLVDGIDSGVREALGLSRYGSEDLYSVLTSHLARPTSPAGATAPASGSTPGASPIEVSISPEAAKASGTHEPATLTAGDATVRCNCRMEYLGGANQIGSGGYLACFCGGVCVCHRRAS